MTKAEIAVAYMLKRIQEDGRLAYLLGYTEAESLLLQAGAEASGGSLEELTKVHRSLSHPIRVTRIYDRIEEI